MIDLLDLTHYSQAGPPHHLFAQLRADDPVHWHAEREGPGFWALTRYDDVVRVSRDSQAFSSHRGGTMIPDAPEEQLAVLRMMMLNMDPPQHTKLRALVNKGFTPRMVERLRAGVETLSRNIVDAVAPRGGCDFVTDVAGELPSYVIAELVGIPLDDGRLLYRLTERMHTATPTPEGQAGLAGAFAEMIGYSGALRDAKRRRPGDDIASVLLAAEVDGERLSDAEFDLFFMLLINAGGDTTRNLVAGGPHPQQRPRSAWSGARRLGSPSPTLTPSNRKVYGSRHEHTSRGPAILGDGHGKLGDRVVAHSCGSRHRGPPS